MLRAESVSIFFFFFFTKPILKRVLGVDNFLSSELLTIISTVFLLYFLLIIFFFFEVEICDIAKSPEKFDIQRQLRRNNAPDVKDKSFRQQG